MISLVLLGFAFWLRADYERYTWAISGPFPFSQLGGGPALAALTVVTLAVTTICVGTAIRMHRVRRVHLVS